MSCKQKGQIYIVKSKKHIILHNETADKLVTGGILIIKNLIMTTASNYLVSVNTTLWATKIYTPSNYVFKWKTIYNLTSNTQVFELYKNYEHICTVEMGSNSNPIESCVHFKVNSDYFNHIPFQEMHIY